jgi:hypothetical protein
VSKPQPVPITYGIGEWARITGFAQMTRRAELVRPQGATIDRVTKLRSEDKLVIPIPKWRRLPLFLILALHDTIPLADLGERQRTRSLSGRVPFEGERHPAMLSMVGYRAIPPGQSMRQRLHRFGRSDLLPLWAGQSANLSTYTDVLAFLTSLVEEVSEIAGPIIQWSAARREKQLLK